MACITTNDINGHKIVQLALQTLRRPDSLPPPHLAGTIHTAAQPVANPIHQASQQTDAIWKGHPMSTQGR